MAHRDECPTQDPDECFGCKMAYMREHGSLSISFQGGRDFFNRTTIRTEQDRIKAQAKAKGNPEPVPYHSIYGS